MTVSIPALIAEARDYIDHGTMPREQRAFLRALLERSDALESLSAPSGDDREALIGAVTEAIGGAVEMLQVDAVAGPMNASHWKSRIATLAVDACRRPSPVTREALYDVIRGSLVLVDAGDIEREHYEIDPNVAADAILSKFSLPEPAEVEWAHAANGEQFMEWSDDPRGALAHRTKAGLPVEEGTK